MKTFIILSSFILVFFSSCGDKQNSTAKKETTVEAPKMDIHTAILTNDLKTVQQHIEAGSNINVKEPMAGSTPLMTACTFNKKDIAEALIKANADLSIQNNDGSTALHIAAFFGRIEMVQLLIDAKADKTLKNNFGATPRETVLGDFAQVKPIYEMLMQQLQPMGFTLDLKEVEKARPVIAVMLQ
jgi:ankyrin repeat protein